MTFLSSPFFVTRCRQYTQISVFGHLFRAKFRSRSTTFEADLMLRESNNLRGLVETASEVSGLGIAHSGKE